jgi:drug/metabolite transporter (DMT)-like permease
VIAAVSFGSISLATVLAKRDGMPLVMLLMGRYAIAGVLLIPMSGGWRRLVIEKRRALQLVIIGGVGQTLVSVLSLAALDYITAATMEFLFYTYPVWVVIYTRIRGSDPITPRRLVALALALGGVVAMVGLPGAQALHPAGVALGIGAAMIYGVYVPTLGVLQRDIEPGAATFYICVGVALVLGVAGVWRGDFSMSHTLASWGAMVWMAVVSTVLAFHLFLRGLETLGPVRTAIIATIEPFSVSVVGIFLLQQPLTVPVLAGGALIAAAVLVMNWRR